MRYVTFCYILLLFFVLFLRLVCDICLFLRQTILIFSNISISIMKKLAFILFLLGSMSAFALVPLGVQHLQFGTQIIKPTGTGNPYPRTPVRPPVVGWDGLTLYFETDHPTYNLVFVNEEGEEVYSIIVPTSIDEISLPTALTGSYELQLYNESNFYFYCNILL